MQFKIKLSQVKIIWTEIGLYFKTIQPVPYRAQCIPLDTKIIMKGDFAIIEVNEDDYKKYNLKYFDYETIGIEDVKNNRNNS